MGDAQLIRCLRLEVERLVEAGRFWHAAAIEAGDDPEPDPELLPDPDAELLARAEARERVLELADIEALPEPHAQCAGGEHP